MDATYIVATGLTDRNEENGQQVRKYYILENEKSWKEGESSNLVNHLEKSRLIQGVSLGTVICSPDLADGYSKVFYFDKYNYILKSCLCIRNIDQEIQQGQYAILLAPAEKAIADFDQDLLVEEGLEAFRTEWCDRNRFV